MRTPLRALTGISIALGLLVSQRVWAAPYDSAVLSDNPLNYWRLGDGTTTIVDSQSANNGTAEAPVLLGQTSLVYSNPGNAAIRTAAGSRVAVPGYEKFPLGATGYSAEYWVRVDTAASAFRNVLGDGESGGDFYMMNYVTNPAVTGTPKIRPHFSPNNAPVALDSLATVNTGEIYHVISTWDRAAGRANVYINGVLDNTVVTATNAPINTNNAMFIGRDNREPGGDLTIDDASFYTGALTAAQVRNHRVMGYVGAAVPNSLAHYWNLDESPTGTANASNIFGTANTGVFGGAATRTAGLIGEGAATFNNTVGAAVNVGAANFSFTTGLTIEALIAPTWSGTALDYDEIFRKEDGGNRILLSFQNDTNDSVNGPVLGFGLNVGGVYSELDMPLDGLAGRPTLAALTDGDLHQVVASYDSVTGQKSIFIDGELAFSQTLAGLIASGGGAIGSIGNIGPGGGEPFTGIIDELAIFNSALSAADIRQHFANVQAGNNFFTAAVPEPVSCWIWGATMLIGLGYGWRKCRH